MRADNDNLKIYILARKYATGLRMELHITHMFKSCFPGKGNLGRGKLEVVLKLPQGAILSSMLFNIYMHPLAPLVESFGLGCHQDADIPAGPSNLAKRLEAMV